MSDSVVGDSGGGGLIGGQLGCNVQTGQIVFGLEGEAAWSGLSNSFVNTNAFSFSNFTDRSRWSADLAVRAGIAVDRALIYGKAGVAAGRVDFSFSSNAPESTNGSGTLTGLLLGGGIEYAFAPHWSARLEYDHIDYISKNLPLSDVIGGVNITPRALTLSASTSLVKAGVNYQFGDSSAAAVLWPAPSPLYTKAPPIGRTYDWTGCYAGIHGGGATQSDPFESGTYTNGGGGLAGGQVGCNRQIGQLVFGLEGEGAWANLIDRLSSTSGNSTFQIATRSRWDADLAARAGIAIDRALIYTKAGLASGGFDFSASNTNGVVQNASGTFTGLLLGGGIEYAFAPNWSAKLEFDHIDYLGKTLQFSSTVGGGVNTPFTATLSASANLVKAGVNYQFNGQALPAAMSRPPMPAATYNWSGCYAGVQTGGGAQNDSFVGIGSAAIGAGPINGGGGLAGGQAGCNMQIGRFVFGVEGEGAWANLVDRASEGGFISNQAATRNIWSADLAARAGVAVGRALIYTKAGIAAGRFDFAENDNNGVVSDFTNGSATLTGLVFGAGFEYAFAANWSAKLEFDRIDYLGRGVPFAAGGINSGVAFINPPSSLTESATSNVAKVGVNYRFFGGGSDPVIAKY